MLMNQMKYYKSLILLVVVGLCSCEAIAQQPDNTRPMYGEVQKSDEFKKIDEDFKKDCIEKFKSVDSAAVVYVDFGWRYFYHNDLKAAMKRFNQAWLLNPEYADSYFGFAALMDMEGNQAEASRFYRIGEEKDSAKGRAKVCYKKIADCKEQLQDLKGAIDAYTKLSVLSPNDAFSFKKIGYLQMQSGNSKEALVAYEKAISLDPADAVTYSNRGY